MKKSVMWVIIAIALLFILVAWYLASPLFIDKVVQEDFPIDNSAGSNIEETQALYQGNFVDADSFHKVSGVTNVLSDGEKTYLRFEDFQATNGPDLKVYLSEDVNADSYVSLGDLKGNIGNQNYEIPEGTDLNKYKYALVWCEAFSTLFGYAELN